MKNLILIATLFSSICFAGNGSGTMMSLQDQINSQLGTNGQVKIFNPGRPVDIKSIWNSVKNGEAAKNGDIIYYQGETQKDLYIQYGVNAGSEWKLKGFKIEKDNAVVANPVLDAIKNSKLTNDWVKIE